MKTWLALFIAVVMSFATVAALKTSRAPVHRPLTTEELRATLGAQTWLLSCRQLVGTDCTGPAYPGCGYCQYSMSTESVPPCAATWKRWAGFPFGECDETQPPNNWYCVEQDDQVCWSESRCRDSGLQNAKECVTNSLGNTDCQTTVDSAFYYCRRCSTSFVMLHQELDTDDYCKKYNPIAARAGAARGASPVSQPSSYGWVFQAQLLLVFAFCRFASAGLPLSEGA